MLVRYDGPTGLYPIVNLIGFDLENYQLNIVKYPRTELVAQMAFKGSQFGALAGVVGGASYAAYTRRPRSDYLALKHFWGVRGVKFGAFTGCLCAIAYISAAGQSSAVKACAAFRSNQSSLFIDRVSLLGLGAGVWATRLCRQGWKVPPGAVFYGYVGGIIAGGVLGSIYKVTNTVKK